MKYILVVLAVLGLAHADCKIRYNVKTITHTARHSESGGVFTMNAIGTNGREVYLGKVDNSDKDTAANGGTDHYHFENVENVGQIACVRISTKDSTDKWTIDYLIIDSSLSAPVKMVNTKKTAVSIQSSEGVKSLKLCGKIVEEGRTYTYNLKIKTVPVNMQGWKNPGTKDHISVNIIGEKGAATGFMDLGNGASNFLNLAKTGHVDNFDLESPQHIANIKCVEVSTDGKDALAIADMSVNGPKGGLKLYNRGLTLLSGDPKEGIPVIKFCRAGNNGYEVKFITATREYSGTGSGYVSLEINGENGEAKVPLLNHFLLQDYQKGATDTFVLRDLQAVGRLKCVVVRYDSDDAWDLVKVTVRHINAEGDVTFKPNGDKGYVTLSKDPKEGATFVKMCR